MRQDEQAALRELHGDYAQMLWRFAMRLVHDRAQAQDVVQETLLRAWQHPEVLTREPAALRAGLFTVARNLVIDEWRSARHRHEFGTDQLPETPADDATERVLDAWLVGDAMESLSADHREVIRLAYYGGRDTASIAVELDIPEGTVKSRLHYGLRALRLALEERGVSGR